MESHKQLKLLIDYNKSLSDIIKKFIFPDNEELSKEVLYVGIADCGCCVAVMVVDLSNIDRLKDAVEDIKQWQSDGLKIELKDFDFVKKNIMTCPHIKNKVDKEE